MKTHRLDKSLSVTDPVGNVTKYTYDANNRRATMTLPTGGVTTYTYDLADNLVQTTNLLGRIVQRERMVSIHFLVF